MLNQSIKAVIESLTPTTIYLRAATLSEANKKTIKTKIGTSPVAIVAGLSTTDYAITNTVTNKLTTIEIYFLYLNSSQDDDGEQIDVMVDNAQGLAEQFVQLMIANTEGNPVVSLEDYKFDAEPAYQFGNEILTGGLLTLDWPEVVETYYCG